CLVVCAITFLPFWGNGFTCFCFSGVEFLSTPYFFIIFACFPLFLGGKFFYPFFKPLGYKESVTSQLPRKQKDG
ncbi:hypothetical protein P9214_12395, partial [Heyndrickxia coagulans]|uniref:hypothetical protein n=1 Tax=Heyndrickxia coagulans TaxID=1398 RepID=UPI002E1BAF62|nr:hypothetical protein [Heyndrickxia coagulans]